MRLRFLPVLGATLLALTVTTAGAQDTTAVAAHIEAGDRDYTAMNAAGALAHYEEALKVDAGNYVALWRAARSLVDLAEFMTDRKERDELFRKAELYARRAVEIRPEEAEGHFQLAQALGRTALTLGTRDRVKMAKVIRDHALEALKIDPKHPGALHVMGVWNAEIMRLNPAARFMAKNFLGGQIFGSASWRDAIRYMEESRDAEPWRLVHRLDLARVYRDADRVAAARIEYQKVLQGAATDYNDRQYKAEAAVELKKLPRR